MAITVKCTRPVDKGKWLAKKKKAAKSYLVSIRTQRALGSFSHAKVCTLPLQTEQSNEQREHGSACGLAKESRLLIVPLKAMLIVVLKNMRSSGH